MDTIVRNGQLIDGTGNPWFRGDVAITDGKITDIGNFSAAQADRIIDAAGLVVAPGFIDIHSHSDTVLLINPQAESKIRQGVTTEIVGNCGNSAAPLVGGAREEAQEACREYGQELGWESLGQYLD